MQKPPIPHGKRLYKFKIFRSFILPKINSKKQLNNYITEQRLTESLELLENQGYSGDDAIRRLQYLQWEGIC